MGSITPRFKATVLNGDPIIDQNHFTNWVEYLSGFEGKTVALIIKPWAKDRSRRYEKYYHAVIVEMVAGALGMEHQPAHDFLRNMFLQSEESCMIATGEVIRYDRIKSTTELSSAEYLEYGTKCINWAALPTSEGGLSYDSGLGLFIPDPNQTDYEPHGSRD